MHQNQLHLSKSPYLQQHAENPVHWQSWENRVLEYAQKEDKLIILSIGYSACHWCHVMEREVFEKNEAAEVMNKHFVSIKVDREERPDIDEVYMRALQLMKGQGGWPLNLVCLPDGKPIWGATYLGLEKWLEVLEQIAEMYREDKERVLKYGEQLTQGIQQSMLVNVVRSPLKIKASDLDQLFAEWSKVFDPEEGGPKRAPKFPMPVNWNFLLEYGIVHKNQQALNQVELSLDKMAMGGIYDQIGGGFARYSVDALWKVPHFEKMLYDNAQLISLYSKAYRHFKKETYRQVISQSWDFLEREMRDPSGAWYSALDADSEGVEGKFYTWTKDELATLIPAADWPLFAAYYSLNEQGYWEKGQYILLRRESDEAIQARFQIEGPALKRKVSSWQKLLLNKRESRVRPGLDDKALSSWNGLMISAACEAYRASHDEKYRQSARETANWLLENQLNAEQALYHAWQKGEAHIEGLLEDYTFNIEAFIQLWQISGEESYLIQATKWTEKILKDFEDRQSGLFQTRSKKGEALISRSIETQDNVIPAPNSVMAHNLYQLGLIWGKSAWIEQAQQNLAQVKSKMLEYGESFANWARLALYQAHPFYEISIVGADADNIHQKLVQDLRPLEFCFFSLQPSDLKVFEGRFQAGEYAIYPCQQGACQMPYKNPEDFMENFRS